MTGPVRTAPTAPRAPPREASSTHAFGHSMMPAAALIAVFLAFASIPAHAGGMVPTISTAATAIAIVFIIVLHACGNVRPLAFPDHGVAQHADARHLHLHHVAVLHVLGRPVRAHPQHVARVERQVLAHPADEFPDPED